jgi:DNA modification methylase
MTTRIITGDCRAALAAMPDESVHMAVTSPPYYSLRDYGIEPQVWGGEAGCEHVWGEQQFKYGGGEQPGEKVRWQHTGEGVKGHAPANAGQFCQECGAWLGSLGLENTPALYVEHMVAVFREVRRVLRRDGTLWLNISDSFANKQLLGIPWKLAFALQADDWIIRSEITWAKKAPMPESVTDRPTGATEKVFLLTKSARYFYDAEAVKEDVTEGTIERWGDDKPRYPAHDDYFAGRDDEKHIGQLGKTGIPPSGKRNMRNFWLLGPAPFNGQHFASFSPEIPRRAILAGTSAKGVCPKCGAPWERVLSKTKGDCEAVVRPKHLQSEKSTLSLSGNGSKEWAERGSQVETIGWRPTCSCEDWRCPKCAIVLDNINDARVSSTAARVRELRQDVSSEEARNQVLQSPMLARSDPQVARSHLPLVQDDVPTQRREDPPLLEAMRPTMERAESIDDPRVDDNFGRLQTDPSAGTSECEQIRLRVRTPPSHGEEARAVLDEGRSRSPQERHPPRQSDRQPRTDAKASTRRQSKAGLHGDLSGMQGSVSHQGQCPHCGSLLERTTPAAVSATILDCFLGAGTTGLVADQLGRDCIGIELSQSYAEMAERRIRDDAGLFAEIATE